MTASSSLVMRALALAAITTFSYASPAAGAEVCADGAELTLRGVMEQGPPEIIPGRIPQMDLARLVSGTSPCRVSTVDAPDGQKKSCKKGDRFEATGKVMHFRQLFGGVEVQFKARSIRCG